MGIYDISITKWKDKALILPADKDQTVEVNSGGIHFEGEDHDADLSQIVEFLSYYGRDLMKPLKQRDLKFKICFLDGVERSGNRILFDKNGEPVIRVEDGKILSAAHDCICDRTFPEGSGARHPLSGHDALKDEIENSGIFGKGKVKRRLYGKDILYKCLTCGKTWTLGDKDISGIYIWRCEDRGLIE